MNNKFNIKFGLCFFVFILLLPWVSVADESSEVVAKANSVPITLSEVEEEIGRIISRTLFHKEISPEKRQGFRKEATEKVIDMELRFQEAKTQGIKAEKKEIKKKIEDIKKRFPSDKEFKEALKKSKLSLKDLEAKAERGILMEKVFKKEVEEKIKVSDDEAKAHYETNIQRYKEMEQVKLRHIMIKFEENPPVPPLEKGGEGGFEEKEKEAGAASSGAEAGGKIDNRSGREDDRSGFQPDREGQKTRTKEEAKAKAEELLARIKKGEDFASVASENSDDSYRDKGGDLGYVQRGRIMPELEETAFKTAAGEIMGPVETKEGFYIIKVEDHKQEKQLSFDEAKDNIKKELEMKKKDERTKEWLSALRAKAKIEYVQVKSE